MNLSSDDMRVDCVLERFEQERVANKLSDPLFGWIAGETSDEQFLVQVAGLDRPNDIHVAEIFSQPKTMATASRMGLTPGLVFDMDLQPMDRRTPKIPANT